MVDVTNAQIAAIPGWFARVDVGAFRALLPATTDRLGSGDLAELGVYRGKSAVLIGSYLRADETFTVVDLFEGEAGDEANAAENASQYSGLSRVQFEAAYRSLHGSLPVVVQDFSTKITEHATAGRHRFVHIDASHLYEHVVQDIANARTLLQSDGVVVIDDFRHEHTPGVAAAAWQAVGSGLHPFLLTGSKMYGTWGDPRPYRDAIEDWLDRARDIRQEHQVIGTDDVIRAWGQMPAGAHLVPPAVLPVLQRLRARWA